MVEDECNFAKTICSICYEDLKPIVEDLQAIPNCGHVFHELCLQQWFEYCSSSSKKKCSCPICKQTCSQSSVGRLYFQSIGDPNDQTLPQKPVGTQDNPQVLRRDVKILEVKVSGLNSALEQYQKSLNETNEELSILKEQAKTEAILKNDALSQKAVFQQMLLSRSEEINKSTSECLRLQERNMALAKELAAFKLISDVNLDEEEVLKLASLGNNANSNDAVDILKKSLVIRNKSYNELMGKCRLLGRGEACSLQKLEKAEKNVDKLKARVQELESAIEIKDNEALRDLKASKKSNCNVDNGVQYKCSSPYVNIHLSEYSNMDQSRSLAGNPIRPKKKNSVDNIIEGTRPLDQETMPYFLIDDDDNLEIPKKSPTYQNAADTRRTHLHGPGTKVGLGFSSSSIGSKNDMENTHVSVPDQDEVMHLDDAQVQPLFQIRKESSSPVPLAQPGDQCFSGGLLGPDGTSKYLGKWCKRSHDKDRGTGDLISVGADGRGGRVKVLRTVNQSLDGKATSSLAKRCKIGAKTSSSGSQGCLQIEHFFGKRVDQ